MIFSDPEKLKNKHPLLIILRGAALPGIIVAVIVAVAVVMSLLENGDYGTYLSSGIGLGLFFTLWGGIEIMAGLLFQSKDIRTNALLAIGYAMTWAACIFLIFKF